MVLETLLCAKNTLGDKYHSVMECQAISLACTKWMRKNTQQMWTLRYWSIEKVVHICFKKILAWFI